MITLGLDISTSTVGYAFVENNKFLEAAWQLGRGKLDGKGAVRGGYIFENPVVDSVTGIKYTTQLKDTSLGILNNKYVTPELAMMFGQRKGLLSFITKSDAYKYFLGIKINKVLNLILII